MSLLISFNISLQEQKNFYQFYTSEEDKKLFDDDEKVYILGKIFGLDLNSLFFRKHEIHSSNLLTKICATRDEPHHESIDKNLINQSQTKIKQLKNPLDFFNKSTDKKLCEEGLSDQNQNATIHII